MEGMINYLLISIPILIFFGIISFTIMAIIAFSKTEKGVAKTFSYLIRRSELVKLSIVCLVILSVLVLSINDKLSSNASIVLGSIVAYILGGINYRKSLRDEEKENSNIKNSD